MVGEEQLPAANIIDYTAVDGDGEGGQVIIQFQYLLTKPRRIVPCSNRKRRSGM